MADDETPESQEYDGHAQEERMLKPRYPVDLHMEFADIRPISQRILPGPIRPGKADLGRALAPDLP